ncbi:MAG TPA: DNA adenine methylase [Candidatus Massiliomicrobiota merdigallinarum]|nr:DNA adenine methylase [Candidatus Massilimicrobiota merdigallinarum]
MRMNSLISWVGGKKALRELIYQRFPKDYGRYIEVFGGGGWVLFGKTPERNEVYNDYNNNLSNMFAVVRDQPLAFIQELGYLPENGRNIFNLYREIISKQRIEDKYVEEEMKKVKVYFTEIQAEEIKTIMMKNRIENQDVQMAVAFFKLIRYSYGSGCRTFGCRAYDVRKAFSTVWDVSERLAQVTIENKDFEELIIQYDRPDAFFYCDPPYYETEGHYEVVFSKEDHIRLCRALRNIQGKFLLSYNDCEFIRELYKDFYIESCSRVNNMALRYDCSSQFPEVLISNYNPMEAAGLLKQLNLFEMEGDEETDE